MEVFIYSNLDVKFYLLGLENRVGETCPYAILWQIESNIIYCRLRVFILNLEFFKGKPNN